MWPHTRISLLQRIKDPGNGDDWTEFVNLYRPAMVRFCRTRFQIEPSVAEDVAQGILLKLIEEMQRFEYQPDKSFRAWLKTVTRHAVLTYFRRCRNDIVNVTSDSMPPAIAEDNAKEVADEISIDLQRDILREAESRVRQRVDEKTWQVYVQKSRGRKAKEIAEEFGMKIAAVHQAKTRVLKMIRTEASKLLGFELRW